MNLRKAPVEARMPHEEALPRSQAEDIIETWWAKEGLVPVETLISYLGTVAGTFEDAEDPTDHDG
jgi:hypothetical protein